MLNPCYSRKFEVLYTSQCNDCMLQGSKCGTYFKNNLL